MHDLIEVFCVYRWLHLHYLHLTSEKNKFTHLFDRVISMLLIFFSADENRFYLLVIVIRCCSNLNCYWSSHVFCRGFLHIITTTIHLSSFDKSITEVSSIYYSIALLTIVFVDSFPLSVFLYKRDIIESKDRIEKGRERERARHTYRENSLS